MLSLSMFFALPAQSYQIGNTTITFNDPNRSGGFGSGGGPGRQIQTEIYYPSLQTGSNVAVANGSFPLIVFGHGFAMTWSAYQNIWEAFAAQGYIVAFPRTEASLLPPPSHQDFGEDLALVETAMQNLNVNNSSLFFQKISPNSAIMGHSMGGGASFIAAANNSSPSLKAVVGLAPAETNPSAIAAASNVNVDALILSGSSDGVTPPSSNHQPIYDNLASSCKTFLSISNGSHCYFANSNFNCDFGELTTGTGSLPRAEQQDITKDYVKLFLDFKLNGSCLAWDEFLDSLTVSTRVIEQQQCTYGSLQPSVNITGNSSYCNGSTALLSATSNPNYSYSWFLDGISLNSQGDTLLASSPGQYSVIASNSLGCIDSALFNLNVLPTYFTSDTVFACIGSSYTFPDGFVTSSDTTYLSNLLTVNSCDSLVNRTVFFGSNVLGNKTYTPCPGDSVLIGSILILNDTSFVDTIPNGSFFGCDSISNYTVSFKIPDTVQVFPSICQNENYQLPNGLFVNYTDTFSFNFTDSHGCDSTYIVNLTVGNPIPTFNVEFYNFLGDIIGDTVILVLNDTISYDSLVWNSDGSSTFLYQSSDTAFFELNAIAGTYTISLTVFNQGCSRTVDTQLALVSNREQALKEDLFVFPNPTQKYIQVSSSKTLSFIRVFNILGELVLEITPFSKEVKMDCTHLESGLYILQTPVGKSFFIRN